MKRSFFLLITVLCAAPLSAQVLDSLLLYRSIFELFDSTGPYGNRVVLVQQEALYQAVQQQILRNESKKIQGFRIRIFNSNQQTARNTSQAILEEFQTLYPHVKAYLDFKETNYRVTVGDFRTRSEAMRFRERLITQPAYRSAVIVKEAIGYPEL